MKYVKFRVWDGQKMRSWAEVRNMALYDILEENHLGMSIYEAMQFTGLKDNKNGVDIYEGDIVTVSKRDHHGWAKFAKLEVVWGRGCWRADHPDGRPCSDLATWESIEVIGNIHQTDEKKPPAQ